MPRHQLCSAIGAIALAVGLLSAAPAGADVHPSGASVAQTSQDDSAASLQRELDAFPRARISVADGIARVEKRDAGSKVVDISFDGRNARLIYNVKTARNGRVWEGRIDATTGEIIGAGTATPLAQFPPEDQRKIADLDTANMGFVEAIEIAETYGAGKAISAGLNEVDGHLAFLIVVVSDGQLKAVSIDPTSSPTASKTPRIMQPVSAR